MVSVRKESQKKQVILLFSAATPTTSEKRKRGTNEMVEKPDIILEYNRYMGGVDVADMMLYTYLDERRTVKYWKKVVFHIMSRMVVNSYILYCENVKPIIQPPQRPKSRFRSQNLLLTQSEKSG